MNQSPATEDRVFYEMEPADYDEIEAERAWHEAEMRDELASEQAAAEREHEDEIAAMIAVEEMRIADEDGFDVYAGQFEVYYQEDDLPF